MITKNLKSFFIYLFFIFIYKNSTAQINIGDSLINIKMPDTLGHWQELNQYKDKLVIVGFWASWCSPCRRYSSPFLVEMYNKYHSKGLEIFAVSLDKDYHAWVAAMQKDKFTFTNVNDAYGWNGNSAHAYKISSIPAKFLMYKGKIILNQTAAMVEMEAKIKEILRVE